MRVAMLGQYPLDEACIVGGVEAVMVPLVHSLSHFADLQLHVITCLPGAESRLSTTQNGLPLHILQRKRMGRATFHIRDVWNIRRTLRALSPHVVHAQGLGIYAAAATYSPYPHVVTAHGIIFREAEFASGLMPRWRGFMDSVYESYCLARTKNLISISPYVAEELLRHRDFHGRVFAIENPVHDLFFTVSDEEQEEGTILYAGRVIPRKGLLELLQALVMVRKAMPRVCLRVAGETESAPAYYEACQQFIAEQALASAVTFLGSLNMEQMCREYARCTVVAVPSKQETAPVVVAEAMAAGRPVVATRVCGIPYMVAHEDSGLLVSDGDITALADALQRVLSDEPLRKRMGQRGHELAEARFRAQRVAHQTREVYQQLAEGK